MFLKSYINQGWVDQFYQKPELAMLAETRRRLLEEHRPENAIFLAIDQQAAFGAQPGSPIAQKILAERSFGAGNLRQTAEFIGQAIDLHSWVVLTILQHGGRTSVDRFRHQQDQGLTSPRGQFYLCPEGSYDIIIHPLLLKYLGLNSLQISSFEGDLLEHSLSANVGEIFAPGAARPYRAFDGDYLPVVVKPERTFDEKNLAQLMCVQPTDIFLAGADIHVCVKEIADMLKTGIGVQPLIWIIHDLSTTRPGEFDTARREIEQLSTENYKIYLANQDEARSLLGKNRITHQASGRDDYPYPPLPYVVRELTANKDARSYTALRFGSQL